MRKRRRSKIQIPKRSYVLRRAYPYILKGGLILIILSLSGFSLYRFNGWILSLEELRLKELDIHGDYPGKDRIKMEVKRYCFENYGDKNPNILRINLKGLKEELEKIPGVKEVELQRLLPHTLRIKVKKRIPIALIPTENSLLGCDKKGTFSIDSNNYDLPFITGWNKGGMKRAIKVLKKAKDNFPLLFPVISEVNVSSPKNLYLYTVDGTKVLLGDVEGCDLARKLKKLCLLLGYLKRKSLPLEYIDLRFDRIIIKPKGD